MTAELKVCPELLGFALSGFPIAGVGCMMGLTEASLRNLEGSIEPQWAGLALPRMGRPADALMLLMLLMRSELAFLGRDARVDAPDTL